MDERDVVVAESLEGDPEFLRALLAHTSEGMLTIDADSTVLAVNPAIERILGYEPEELLGSSKLTIIPERLQDAHLEGISQYVETGEKHIDWTGVELPAQHKDGHEVPVSVSLQEHEYDGRQLFTGIFTDISERKRREKELRERNEDLEEFASVLSHDLRNPLSVAQAQISLAREFGEEEYFENVEDALARIDGLVDDLLAQAREGRDADVEPCSLQRVVEDAWGSVVTEDASVVLPSRAWRVEADEGRLRQALENLVRNAVEHAGADGTVTVGVLDDESGFFVADDGPGFPTDVLRRGAPGPEEGHYGLHVVERVADAHGWTVRFTNGADGGARVEFRDVSLSRA
ncbi:PAS domain S-box protein [Salarchaeum japonicum]|uniref:histidine kinase n=1 Tax=Salarchaeum japonicum TaxID=555573 RepID=A0AAV3SYY9_9EURY|nr:PAS domain-containing sensor histidine kinase [Salarchaeum japonicum]